MSIEHPPHEEQVRHDGFRNVERAGNVVPLRKNNDMRQANEAAHQDGEFLAACRPCSTKSTDFGETKHRIRKPIT